MGRPARRLALAAALAGLTAGAAAAQTPRLSAPDAMQLMTAAGLTVQGGRLLNPCGRPTNPQLRFGDMNADGVQEAIAFDRDPACYDGTSGTQSKVLARTRTGQWHLVAVLPGAVTPLASRGSGWIDLGVAGPGCQAVWRFDGRTYQPAGPCSAGAAPPTPTARAEAPKAPPPASAATAASGSGQDAIFRAAGAERKRGQWTGCPEAPADSGDNSAALDGVRDINGDGRPDAVVTFNGTFCYGAAGQAFAVVTQQPDGRWVRLASQSGIPNFLPSKGRDGWPDIEVGGPGFCFPVLRWNGREYAVSRWAYEGKPCRR